MLNTWQKFDSEKFSQRVVFFELDKLDTSTELKEEDKSKTTEHLEDTARDALLAKEKEEVTFTRVHAIAKMPGKEGVEYNLAIFLPSNFDGSIDMYLPGDSNYLETALKTKPLRRTFERKLRGGSKSALVVVEGKRDAVKDVKDKHENRYVDLRGGGFESVVTAVSGAAGKPVTDINLLGYSRGGSGMNFALSEKGPSSSKIKSVGYLDATYFSADPIIRFARRGGIVNIAYRVGEPTEGSGKKVVRELGLRQVAPGHWQSADKKVNVYATTGLKHIQVAQKYVGPFMQQKSPGASSAVASETPIRFRGTSEALEGAATYMPEKVIEYGGGHLQKYLDLVEKRKQDPEAMKEFDEWANKQNDEMTLRRADVSVKENLNDFYEKHVRLASKYLKKLEDKNEHALFEIDFAGNELAEWKIGMGHLFPPTVEAIRVYDQNGNVLVNYAERRVVGEMVGYYVPDSNMYAPVHSGYQVEVLGAKDEKSAEIKERIASENEVYMVDAEKLVLRDEMKSYFERKDIKGVVVDDAYFSNDLGEYIGRMNSHLPGWMQKYQDGEDLTAQFTAFFDKEFEEKDLNLLKNLLLLRRFEDGALEELYMSDYMRLKYDSKFDPLKEKVMTEAELNAFQKEKMENKNFSEFVCDTAERMANEQFVKGFDSFGNTVLLRAGAMKAFNRAKQIAESGQYSNPPGKAVKLKVFSSYRTFDHQKRLFEKQLIKEGGDEKKAEHMVARAGNSNHHTGGTIDIVAMVDGVGDDRHKNQELLKKIMPRAGFVNLKHEPWHWEIYSARWKKYTRGIGPIYNKEESVSRGKLPTYEEYLRDLSLKQKEQVAEKMRSVGIDVVSTSAEFVALLQEAGKRALKTRPGYFQRKKCEQATCAVAESALELILGGKFNFHIAGQPIDTQGTAALRGRRFNSMTMADFQALKPGVAIYVANPEKYKSKAGIDIKPGTSDKIAKVGDTDRHWFLWNGKSFSDNMGVDRSLSQVQGWVRKYNTVVVNVHDPFAQYRNKWALIDGQVKIKAA